MKRRDFIGLATASTFVYGFTQAGGSPPEVKATENPNLITFKEDEQEATLANPYHEKEKVLSPAAIKRIAVNAMMQTVASCEGTWEPGMPVDVTYRMLFGKSLFDSYEKHPDIIVSLNGYDSSAAGAYQFMWDTWTPLYARYKNWYAGDQFSPINQDLGFIRLFTEVGGMWRLEKGIKVVNQYVSVDKDWLYESLNCIASTWSGVPGSNRGASGGVQIGSTWYPAQPQKSFDFAFEVFNAALDRQQREV